MYGGIQKEEIEGRYYCISLDACTEFYKITKNDFFENRKKPRKCQYSNPGKTQDICW